MVKIEPVPSTFQGAWPMVKVEGILASSDDDSYRAVARGLLAYLASDFNMLGVEQVIATMLKEKFSSENRDWLQQLVRDEAARAEALREAGLYLPNGDHITKAQEAL
jgi:hypothetical protein